MSFLTDASLVFIPSGYKEDKAYSIKPTDGSGDLTFARASDGTRVNSDGLVERVPWNLLQYSNAFSTSPWSAAASTLTSGQSGYDGSSNAWLITQTSAYGRLRYYLNITGTHTYSAYFKPGNTNWVCLFVNDGSIDKSAFFNLTGSGSIGDTNNLTSASIESVGNGWYRCSIVANYTAGDEIRVYPSIQNDFSTSDKSVYIQDAQLNEGTLKPYFPTTNRQDVPRLDYSNGCPCLLLEPQRTNLLTYSEQFDNGAWSKLNATITANSTTSPDGTTNADRLVESATTGIHRISKSFTPTATGSFTSSVIAKADARIWIAIQNDFGSNNTTQLFNLDTGQIGSQTGLGGTANIISIGNGWYRCILTTSTSTLNAGACNIYVSSGNNTSSYTGDGTSGVYIWGAQLEAGSYPTSYIPTTSASVTRVADAASKTGISDLIGQSEGTLFLDINHRYMASYPNEYLVNLKDGTNQLWLRKESGGNSLTARLIVGGTNIWTIGVNAIDGRNKIALVYKSTDSVVYLNGSQVSTSSASYSGLTLADFYFNAVGSGNPETKINQAVLFKTRLTNDQLEYLTGNSYSTYATMASQLNYTIQ